MLRTVSGGRRKERRACWAARSGHAIYRGGVAKRDRAAPASVRRTVVTQAPAPRSTRLAHRFDPRVAGGTRAGKSIALATPITSRRSHGSLNSDHLLAQRSRVVFRPMHGMLASLQRKETHLRTPTIPNRSQKPCILPSNGSLCPAYTARVRVDLYKIEPCLRTCCEVSRRLASRSRRRAYASCDLCRSTGMCGRVWRRKSGSGNNRESGGPPCNNSSSRRERARA